MKITILFWIGVFVFVILGGWYQFTPAEAEFVSTSANYVTRMNTDTYDKEEVSPYDTQHATMTDMGISAGLYPNR